MKEYKVKVYDNRTEWFNLNNQLHREDGPAIEYSDGTKEWYINDQELTEEEFNSRTSKKTIKIGDKEVSEETVLIALKDYFNR